MKKQILAVLALAAPLWAQAEFRTSVGKSDLSEWVGVSELKKGVATIESGDSISFTYENMNRRYSGLLRPFEGDAADWYDYAGISFELFLEKAAPTEVSVTFNTDPVDHMELNPSSTAQVLLNDVGWQSVYLPWDLFDLNVGQTGNTLQAVKELVITATSEKNKKLKIRKVEVVKGEEVALDADVQGRSAKAGDTVQYEFEIGNTTDEPQSVQLLVERVGWESMAASLSSSSFKLSPGDIETVTLDVVIPESLPEGIREKQIVKAVPNGKGRATETITFHTAVAVPTPNIVFTDDKWQNVKDKVANYEWAATELAELEKKVSKWKVPAGAAVEKFENRNEYKPIFTKHEGGHLYNSGVAYQLTGKIEYAEKVATLFRRLISMKDGYPVTLHGGSGSFVGEGVFFQGVGRAYDMVRDSGVFTEEEHRLVEHTFRLYIERTIKGNTRGAISNWNVAELTGAFYCALALQDWSYIDSLLNSPSGLYAQIYHGIMGDGWWYECAVGYNTWVASEFSEIALSLEPWGMNLKDRKFQIGTTPHFSLQASRRVGGLHGMEFEKWGSINQNSIGIKDMWDASIPFLDYRGVIFAVNDAKEAYVTGKPYELAYYMYGDPEYAAVINRGENRDLLYGVPDLPEVASKKMTESAYADNFGAVMLRSQTPERQQKEQIQAVLHYGSHGGHHGHFDRLNLISLMRYGRSFYNPEMFWYGYQSYLYKFLVQTSMTKNMVVVDQKQQEPRESFRTFYSEGDMMQSTVVESKSRWSHPPYGGMTYSNLRGVSFEEKSEMENRSLSIPEDAPEYGLCTDYTEDILQRRLMVVTDDYVVLADYYDAEEQHTFDWLIHIKGFQGMTADTVEAIRHTGQMNTDPLSSAQFITDCQWFRTEGTARSSFETRWGEGADNAGARMPNSEDGVLKMDVFNAWPRVKEVMIGTAPENFAVNKRFNYTIAADGETLLDDSTGAWVLGAKEIEANLRGKKQLVLTSRTEKPRNNTLFWGDARLVLNDGSEVFISSLPARFENVQQPAKGEDYYGGPIKLQGIAMANSTPAQPKDAKKAGVVTVDLSGMDVASFKATVGGDFPLGDESQRRKTLAVRSSGTDARYLSVIEPYEKLSVVDSVIAKSANELTVTLKDGRSQVIAFEGLEEGEDIQVSIHEYKDGQLVRKESSLGM